VSGDGRKLHIQGDIDAMLPALTRGPLSAAKAALALRREEKAE